MAPMVYTLVCGMALLWWSSTSHLSCGTDGIKVNILTYLCFITVVKVQLSSQAMKFKRITLVASYKTVTTNGTHWKLIVLGEVVCHHSTIFHLDLGSKWWPKLATICNTSQHLLAPSCVCQHLWYAVSTDDPGIAKLFNNCNYTAFTSGWGAAQSIVMWLPHSKSSNQQLISAITAV
jgi:hypothetical protein